MSAQKKSGRLSRFYPLTPFNEVIFMARKQIEEVCVVGAGQMGSGIAQVCATSGYRVNLFDLSATQLEKSQAGIYRSCEKLVQKGRLSEESFTALKENLRFESKITELKNADLVIEAIIEDESKKKAVFSELNTIVKEEAIFASNTSSISIARLAEASGRASQFIGLHFMNPVPLMKLVEIVTTLGTNSETLELSKDFITSLGKEITLSKNYPGFVVNRILMPMINEAFSALQDGLSSKEEIDKAMKLGTNQPMGPFELADFIGLDTCLSIMEVLYEGTCDSKYRPSLLLREHVENGYFGRKVGRGVYAYS